MVLYKVMCFVTHKMSYLSVVLLILCCQLTISINLDKQQDENIDLFVTSFQNRTFSSQNPEINSTIQTRQARDQKYKGYFNPTGQQGGYYPPPPPYFGYGGPQYNDFSSTLESPIMEPDYGQDETELKIPATEEATSSEADEEDEEQEMTTVAPEATTTLAPFTLADVKVPAPFLRIEYMISFTFFGVMYGLGFFVLFQSLCVPAAKIAVYIVYMILLKLGSVDPVTLEQALEQLPPT